jgi:hypothetical protein
VKVLEERVLKRMWGPKREKVTGDWRKFHTEEVRNLSISSDILIVIKIR